MNLTIEVNQVMRSVEVDPEKPLLWVLREDLGVLGPKYGCGKSLCGACTVLLDGTPVRSCNVQISKVAERSVVTIEGLTDSLGGVVKSSWAQERVPQCGYCQPGQIVSAYALLKENPAPSDADIDRSMTNLCRCGTYPRIRKAVHQAAVTLGSE